MESVICEIEDVENIVDSHNQASGSNMMFSIDASSDSFPVFQSSYTEAAPLSASLGLANPDNDTPAGEVDEVRCREQLTAEAVVDAIFHSLDLLDEMGGSLNNFEDLLLMAHSMYCKGASLNHNAEEIAAKGPKTWADAKKHFVECWL